MSSSTAPRTATLEDVLTNVQEIAARFVEQRAERQRRTALDKADFDVLRDAGFLLTSVPQEFGGAWEDAARSTRGIAEMVRTLAHGDSSVALVATMHPAVTGRWRRKGPVPDSLAKAWTAERDWAIATIKEGHWWGTIVSEPGSGGDSSKSKVIARRTSDGGYAISGQKHFGSGSQHAALMITNAIPEGEDEVDTFIIDLRDQPWDGSAGVKVLAPWDGHGMTATQSHSLLFDNIPVRRVALSRKLVGPGAGDLLSRCLFTAVIVGIVETAIETARATLGKKLGELRPYEQVEWTQVEMEGWLVQQAYEGMLRVVESSGPAAQLLLGKQSVAQLAESAMTRLCRVVGGGTYARTSPFGHWFEDVRALGFLRPPWGFAFDSMFGSFWNEDYATA